MTKAIEVRDLSVVVDGRKVLANISLEVGPGEVVAVTGPTGSGKSTLLKVIAGIIPKLYSSFKLSGHVSVCGLSPSDAVRRGLVAYVPQDPSTYFIGSTVAEELLFVRDLSRLRRSGIIDDVLSNPSRKIHELSDGQLYRLLLAVAIGSGTKVLLLDEPTSHVDPWSLGGVLKLLREYCVRFGASAVIVDHRIELIEDFIDLTLELKGGHQGSTYVEARGGGTGGDEVLISARGLRFTYDSGCYVLNGVDLEVRSGESVAIIGRNGAGKTTLIKLLARLLKPTEGVVTTARPVFMVPQTPVYWFSRDTVKDEVSFYANAWGFRGDVGEVIEMFYLSDVSDLSPYSLSIGEARRLSLALAYVSGAKVLLLDEPTLGLDSASKELLVKLIYRFLGQGSAVVASTHDVDLVRYFSRVYLLNDGVLGAVRGGSAVVA